MQENSICRKGILLALAILVFTSCKTSDDNETKVKEIREIKYSRSSDIIGMRGTDGLFRFGKKIELSSGSHTYRYALAFNSKAKVEITAQGAKSIRIFGPKKIGKEYVRLIGESVGSDTLTISSQRQGRYQLVIMTDADYPGGSVSNKCLTKICEIKTWNLTDQEGEISIVAVGDIGLQSHKAENDRVGGKKYSEYHLYSEMFEGFDYYLNGDINIGNMEIAVTDFDTPMDKKYVFRMPIEGLESAVKAGFNIFSVANNHIGDYGPLGITDTIANLMSVSNNISKIPTASKSLKKSGYSVLGWSGAGVNQEEAEQIKIFEVKKIKVAVASIGIGYYAGLTRPGIANIRSLSVIDDLGRSSAHLKILSVHGGVEYDKNPQENIRKIALRASKAGIDFVHVHHPHIVLPIVRIGKTIIAYSMGNFLLRGARNLAQYESNMDYGLALRLQYDIRRDRITAVEAVTLKDTHRIVLPNRRSDGIVRIRSLNDETKRIAPDKGLVFEVTSSGHGIKRF